MRARHRGARALRPPRAALPRARVRVRRPRDGKRAGRPAAVSQARADHFRAGLSGWSHHGELRWVDLLTRNEQPAWPGRRWFSRDPQASRARWAGTRRLPLAGRKGKRRAQRRSRVGTSCVWREDAWRACSRWWFGCSAFARRGANRVPGLVVRQALCGRIRGGHREPVEDFGAHLLRAYTEVDKEVGRVALAVADEPQQDVLGTDVVVKRLSQT